MAKFVQISSTVDITVTSGLQNKDVTNPDAHVPDRLKINPEWPKYQVLIRKGAGEYPAEIVNWPSVKALANDKIFTIGQTFEKNVETDEDKKNAETIAEANDKFNFETPVRKRRGGSLNDIAGE